MGNQGFLRPLYTLSRRFTLSGTEIDEWLSKESVGFRACQAIFDAKGCEFRLRCLMQGGESGVWLGQMSISAPKMNRLTSRIQPAHCR